jgi:hypothetical protein
MAAVPEEETQRRLLMHQLAVQLYETLVERHGINHGQAELARRLVEATDPGRTAPASSVPNSPGAKVA